MCGKAATYGIIAPVGILEVAMTEAVEQLKSQASVLSAPERAELAFFLVSSLEPEEDKIQEEWLTVMNRSGPARDTSLLRETTAGAWWRVFSGVRGSFAAAEGKSQAYAIEHEP